VIFKVTLLDEKYELVSRKDEFIAFEGWNIVVLFKIRVFPLTVTVALELVLLPVFTNKIQ